MQIHHIYKIFRRISFDVLSFIFFSYFTRPDKIYVKYRGLYPCRFALLNFPIQVFYLLCFCTICIHLRSDFYFKKFIRDPAHCFLVAVLSVF